MEKGKTRLVIHENELYEIDLDCIKRKKEGKTCTGDTEPEKSREETRRKP
ncbi:MAG TPA: hypothetical protein IAA57_00795 [Candidatus Pullilachnospira intestinigallinarum]|nr:hypothetical protein [Candidatus Pullilachnospira intestinigallinarum]